MAERTEDAALRGVLPITIGGQRVELRTLSYDESEEWMDLVAAEQAHVEIDPVPQEGDPEGVAMVRDAYRKPALSVLGLVAAYDRDGKFGGVEGLRRDATKREVAEALGVMLDAEHPFEEGAGRSVVEVFGAPSRALVQMARALGEVDALRLLALSTNGASASSASAGRTSVGAGAASSSSSGGRTRKPRKRST